MAKAMSGSAMAAMANPDGGEAMGKEMQEFMGMMTLNNLIKMAGGAVSADDKYELNEQLNKIKKEV